MSEIKRLTVLEYLNYLQYKKSISKTPYLLPEEYISSEIEVFALKLINNEQIKRLSTCNLQVFKSVFALGKLPSFLNKLYLETGSQKTNFKYSNNEIFNLLSFLKQSNSDYQTFKNFIRIPDIYNMLLNLYNTDIFFDKYINVEGIPLINSDVIKILNILGLFDKVYRNDYYLCHDAALVFYKLRTEIKCIELCATQEILEMLQKSFKVEKNYENHYFIGNIIKITTKPKEKFNCNLLNGFLVEPLETILNEKKDELKRCNREYHKRGIKKEIERIERRIYL